MTRLQRFSSSTERMEIFEALSRDGAVIIEKIVSDSQVHSINDELNAHLGQLPEGNWAIDSDSWIAEFQGYRTKRMQHCVRHSATYREEFLTHPMMTEFVKGSLNGRAGHQSLFASQAIEIWPGEKAQVLHRDGAPFFARLGMPIVGAPEIVVNSLLALTDITEEMGATRVIPRSHDWSDPDRQGTQEETIPATMCAGDVLLLGGRLIHGGGANTTLNQPRRVISTSWTLGFLKSEEAWHAAIPMEEARHYPELVQRYLGLFSPP